MLVLLLIVSVSAQAVVINPDVQFVIGNETYTVYQTMDFSSITIASSYIIFNSTGFYITSGNAITITLVYLNGDIEGAGDDETIVEFYATTGSDSVDFDISGFVIGELYEINRSGNPIAYQVADNEGYISFSNNVWSTQLFTINRQGASPNDLEPPDITDVVYTSSSPLDTQAGFGWENISCTVIDDTEVDQVCVKFTMPDDSQDSFTMGNIVGTNNYFYNITLNIYGDYTYYIWANDTSDNIAVSSNYYISLPPNWDITNDGIINIIDLVIVSNHYGESGDQGWIREDVDNNGEIQAFDMVLVSNHYGEMW